MRLNGERQRHRLSLEEIPCTGFEVGGPSTLFVEVLDADAAFDNDLLERERRLEIRFGLQAPLLLKEPSGTRREVLCPAHTSTMRPVLRLLSSSSPISR